MKQLSLTLVIALLAFAGAAADIPRTLSYQGVLRDGEGLLVEGSHDITFSIYEAQVGAPAIWSETQTLPVEAGIFNAILGVNIPLDMAFDDPYWLGIAIDGEDELAPKVELTSSAYALNAQRLEGYNADDFAATGHDHELDQLSDVDVDAATDGQVLTYDGSGENWIAQTPEAMADGDWTIVGSSYIHTSNDNFRVGIGTDTPTAKLTVRDDQNVITAISIENLDPGENSGERLNFRNEDGDLAFIALHDADNPSYPGAMSIGNNRPGGVLRFLVGGERIRITNSGLVGINNLNPQHSLDVTGTVAMTGYRLGLSGTPGYVLTSDASGFGTWQPAASGVGGSGAAGYLSKFTGATTLGNSVLYEEASMVGVGWASAPYGKFHVDADDGQTALMVTDWSSAGNATQVRINRGSGLTPGNAMVSIEAYTGSPENFYFLNTWRGGVNSFSVTGGGSVRMEGDLSLVDGDADLAGSVTAVVSDQDYAGYFENSNYGSNHYGVFGKNSYTGTSDGVGVYGQSDELDYFGIGGKFVGGYKGVEGVVNPTGNEYYYGVRGAVSGGTGTNRAIYGYASEGAVNYAGYFSGNVHVAGTLSKFGGSFKIDHPLDPENKTLSHSFVESPDMMNVYNGNVTLGADGSAWIRMPEWFEALNRDFRYQLTCIGGFAPVYVAEEIDGNRFRVAGGEAGLKVSWQVTGVRQDAWAEANRIPVEEWKPAREQGTYLAPEAFGQPVERSVDYEAIMGARPAEGAAPVEAKHVDPGTFPQVQAPEELR